MNRNGIYNKLTIKKKPFLNLGKVLYAREDSNFHTRRHHPLKVACLPISPRAQIGSAKVGDNFSSANKNEYKLSEKVSS